MNAIACILTAALASIALWANQAHAQQPITVRLSHTTAPGSPPDQVANRFAKEVNEALKGQVEVKVFHSSQLGTDEQMVKGINTGAADMWLAGTVMSTMDEKFGVFEMPYIIRSRSHMRNVVESKEVQRALFDGLPASGIRVLGVWEVGFRHLTNSVRPIVRPEDLRGIKLRVPGGVWRVKMFQAYGANPLPLSFREVYSALQQGVMDGQENPLSLIWSAKLHEVQKYLSLTGHVYTPLCVVVNEEFYQRLPKDVQATSGRIAWVLGDFARAEGERLDKEAGDKLVPPMQVNEADKGAFVKASAAVYEEFGKQVAGGTDLIRLIQSLR
jgi:TRAP-type transport system periplasmic protein